MRQVTALGLKLAAYLVIFGVTMPVFGFLALSQSMILAAVHTLLLWFGDLLVLPRFGNRVATAVDAMALVLVSLRVLGAMGALPNVFGLLLAIALSVAFEWAFHRWLFETAIVE